MVATANSDGAEANVRGTVVDDSECDSGLRGMSTKEYFFQIAEFYAAGLQAKWGESETGYASQVKKVQEEVVAARIKRLEEFKAAVQKLPETSSESK